jgi:sec-independent protein translocase protein TatA
MPGFIGLPELLVVGLVVLLVFGPKRLPEMGRSMGRGLREFKNSVSGGNHEQESIEIVRGFPHVAATDDLPRIVNADEPRERIVA